MTRHAGLLSQPVPACTPSAAQPAQPCASAGLPGTRTVAAQRLGPGERCKGERWHSCSRPLGERLGKGQVTGASLQCRGKPGNHLQTQVKSSATPLVTWSPPPASLQEDVWQMGQLRPCWVLGGCHSRGCCWPCKVLCPKLGFQGRHGFRGLERHTGVAKQGCLQEARTETKSAEPGHLQEQHSSPCHVWGQAAPQSNPAPSLLPVRVGQAP